MSQSDVAAGEQIGLFGPDPVARESDPAPSRPLVRPLPRQSGESGEAPVSWSDRDADELREVLLQQTLLTIQDGRSAAETIEECWAWLTSDREGGFSFVTCAREAGCDPNELRDVFEAHMRRLRATGGPGEGQLALTGRPWEWLKQAG